MRPVNPTNKSAKAQSAGSTASQIDVLKAQLQRTRKTLQATQRRLARSNRQLDTARNELRHARTDAAAAYREKTEFLSNISHEIRTPLTVISVYAQVMSNRQAIFPDQKPIKAIESNAALLTEIVDDILEIAKLESDQPAISVQAISLPSFVCHICSSLEPRARESGIDFNVRFHRQTPSTIYGNPFQIRQVLINLLGNAIKFTPQGAVSVDVTGQGDSVVIKVRDTGIGMTQSQLTRIFKPVQVIQTGGDKPKAGAGLGLSICRRLTARLGGDLKASSNPGAGSEFVLTLPVDSSPR